MKWLCLECGVPNKRRSQCWSCGEARPEETVKSKGVVIMAKKKLPVRESDIQAAIRDYLRWTGWYVIRHHQTLGSHKGLSDLQAVKNGRTLYIEVKTPQGRLSKHQEAFRDAILAAGGEYIVARCLEDVLEVIGAKDGERRGQAANGRGQSYGPCDGAVLPTCGGCKASRVGQSDTEEPPVGTTASGLPR